MSIGHGAYGVRSNLRRFTELVEDSDGERRPFVELGLGLPLNSAQFSADAGGAYRIPYLRVYDGVVRDVAGVETSEGIGGSVGSLQRVETLAECRAQQGTYFFDIEAAQFATETWDMAGLVWDGATQWDRYPQADLYVHLRNDADPTSAAVTCVAILAFRFGSKGEVHPRLGPNKLGEDLSTWMASASGRWDSGEVWDGTLEWDTDYGWSAEASADIITLSTTGAFTGTAGRSVVVGTVVAGRSYRVSGKYTSSEAFAAGLSIRVLLKPGPTNVMYRNGTTYDASGFIALTPTGGHGRGFLIDFLCPSYSDDFTLMVQLVGGVGEVGSVTFEELAIQRIYRFEFHEPRLPGDAPLESEVAAASMLFGEKTVGEGSISIINGDGVLEPVFGELSLIRKPMQMWVGGVFGDGQEIYAEQWWPTGYGYITKPSCDDAQFEFQIEDARTFLKLELPLRKYSVNDLPNLAKDADGRPRPMLFGEKGPTKPWRIDKTAFGYGIYEWVDTQQAPNGIAGLPARFSNEPGELDRFWNAATGSYQDFDAEIASYVDEENANKPLQTDSKGAPRLGGSYHISNQRLSLLYQHVNHGYTEDNANAQFTVTRSARVVDITPEGTEISWATERGTNTLPEPWERLRDHPNLVEFVRQAIIGGPEIPPFGVGPDPDVMIVLDPTTQKVTVSKPAGFLTLKIATSPVPSRTIWVMLGFNAGADKSGGLSYTGDNPIFSEVNDLDALIIRGIVQGYRDDADGTYTGTPNALIELGPDIAVCLLERWAGIPRSRIDVASFAAGRATVAGARPLTSYIAEKMSVRAILSQIEQTCLADIVIDGAGMITWKPYVVGVPADIRDFYDRDYLSFRITYKDTDVFKGVRVLYGAAHRAEGLDVVEILDDGAATKYGRETIKEITTLVRSQTEAAALASSYFPVATGNPRVAEFSARTKLVDLTVGDKVRLTRSRGIDPTGRLTSVLFRIQSLRTDYLSGITQCTAVEDIPFL
jgi:hypothetical protein